MTQPVPGIHENFAGEAAMSTDKAMVTDARAAALKVFEEEFNGTYSGAELVNRMIDAYDAALAQAGQPVAVKRSDYILALMDGQPMNGHVSYHHEEGGFVEFINEDRPYFVRDLNAPAAILVDVETRKVIGYRVYDPDAHPPAKREAGETLVGKSHELLRRASLTLAEEADHIITGYCASASPPAYLRDAMLRLAEAAAKVKAALEASHE